MRLLLVEDDRMIGESLRAALRLEGHAVDWVRDATAAQAVLASERFDLVLLDLGLPAPEPRPGGAALAQATAQAPAEAPARAPAQGAGHAPARPPASVTAATAAPAEAAGSEGLAVLRSVRARNDTTPVIVITARDALDHRVAGLDAGADDYLVKPFEFEELHARIRAVLRRHAGRAQPRLAHGGVTLDPATRQVSRDGQPVQLSAREFAVLEALLTRPGALLSRAQLEDRLYGWGEEIESNAVSVYIHQLRRKLGPDFIRNVRGVGYFVGGGGPASGGAAAPLAGGAAAPDSGGPAAGPEAPGPGREAGGGPRDA